MALLKSAVKPAKTWKYFLQLLMLAALLLSLKQGWEYGKLTNGFDFYEKWDVGQKLAASTTGVIYSPENLQLHISSPFLYTLVSFFSSGDYARDVNFYRLLCLSSTVLAIIGLSRLLGYPLWASFAAVTFFTYRFQPFLSDVRVANVNQLQLGLLALFLLVQSRRRMRGHNFVGGLILGFAVAAKPNLLFVVMALLAAWLVNRRFRKIGEFFAGATLAAVVAVATSSAAFGSASIWIDWLKILPQASDYQYLVEQANYSISMLLFSLTKIKASPYLTAAFFGLSFGGLLKGSKSAKSLPVSHIYEREFREDILMTGMGCLIYLLSATLVWLHYYLLTIPVILFVFRPREIVSGQHSLVRYSLAVAAIALIAELPLRALFSITHPIHSAILINTGTCILYGLGFWEILYGETQA